MTSTPNKTTLTLSNGSQIILKWIETDRLTIELWAPGSDRYGHGLLYRERAVLNGEQLQDLFSYLAQGQQQEAA